MQELIMTNRYDHPDAAELEQLIARMGAGDTGAVAELYAAAKTQVFGFALSILRDVDDAQDVLQDAFVNAFRYAGRYRPRGKPMAWLLTIAKNLANTKLRQRTRSLYLDEEQWAQMQAKCPQVTSEDGVVLRAALEKLGDKERQIITLYAVSGLKHREIADVLDMPLSTVLSKYNRAKKKLLKLFLIFFRKCWRFSLRNIFT